MVPEGVGAGLLMLILVPGWIFLRLGQRIRPASGATGLAEFLEILAVGVATTGVAFFCYVLIPPGWVPFLLNLNAWARLGDSYLRQNFRIAASSSFVLLLVAVGIACFLHLVQRLKLPAEFRAEGSVWVHALGARPLGCLPWVGLRLTDGRVIEGLLHSFSLTDGGVDERDIALQSPIRVTERDGEQPRTVSIDRLIVSAREIAHIVVVHVPERRD